MQTVGNAVTILGILVALIAYFGEHSGVSVADLEPGLVRRLHRGRAWVLRKLGRTKPITGSINAALELNVALSGMVIAWSPIRPGDDISVRADKLERNLDALRTHVGQSQEAALRRVRDLERVLTERMNTLDQTVAARHEESRRAATSAMRWEVRGLLITLIGAGLAILG